MSMKRKTTLSNIFVNIMITVKIQYYVTQCDTTQFILNGDLGVMNSSTCLSDEERKYKYFFMFIYMYILFSRLCRIQ